MFSLFLRLAWPSTEWETGPEPKTASEMAGSHSLWGWFKMAKKWPDRQKIAKL